MFLIFIFLCMYVSPLTVGMIFLLLVLVSQALLLHARINLFSILFCAVYLLGLIVSKHCFTFINDNLLTSYNKKRSGETIVTLITLSVCLLSVMICKLSDIDYYMQIACCVSVYMVYYIRFCNYFSTYN